MKETDILLKKKLSWLKKQTYIPMIPTTGVGVQWIRGSDILQLRYIEFDALMVVTNIGEFYLIPDHQYESKSES